MIPIRDSCFQGCTIQSSPNSCPSAASDALRKMHERELRRQVICAVHQPYLHMINNYRYTPSLNIAVGQGLPQHPVLAFWSRGPGYRSYHHAHIDTNVDYFVFEPNWLHAADSIMHTTELRVALGGIEIHKKETNNLVKDDYNSPDATTSDTATSIVSTAVDSAMADRVSLWQSQYASWIELGAASLEWEDEEAASCGSGDATKISRTRATQQASNVTHGMCYRYVGGNSSFTIQPISQWPSSHVTHFLFAWQRLQRVCDQMMRANASVFLGLGDLQNEEIESWRGLTVPLPFILPWPMMAVADDRNIEDDDDDDDDIISPKTVSVRGCQWVTMLPNDMNAAHAALARIAQLVAQQLHLHRSLADLLRMRPETFHVGKRPIHADGSNPFERPMDAFIRDASDATLTAVSDLLPSSFLFYLGTEHLYPWPAFLIAPIAPGWVGGFIGGGSMPDY